MGKFPLARLHGFLAASAILIGVVVVVSGLIVGSFFSRYVRDQEKRHTAKIVSTQAAQHLVAGDFDPRTARPGIFEIFLPELPDVFRIKVYDRTGRIVWSDEPRLIGDVFHDDPEIGPALRGEVESSLRRPTSAENVYEHDRAYVTETYVPITLPGRRGIVGVIEVYKDASHVMAGIHRHERRIWAVATAIGLSLYGALAFVVWAASASERRAIARLEAQNREHRLLHTFTSALLQSLELAAVATTVTESIGRGLGLRSASLCRLGPGKDPELLARWAPGEGGPWVVPDPDVTRAVAETGRVIRRGGTVVASLSRPNDPSPGLPGLPLAGRYLFVGDLDGGEPALPLVLEIMLNEAAIALANADLFTAIREGHQRLAAIMAGIADRMVIVDRDLRVVWMNSVAAEACGPNSEGVGLRCFEARGQEEAACHGCPAIRSLSSGRVERDVRVERLPDGRRRYLDLVTAPLTDGTGQVGEVLEVARDVTELVELEDRLRDSTDRLEESNSSLLAKSGELEHVHRALRDAQAQLVARERLAAVGETVVALHHAILNPLTGILGTLRVLKMENLEAATRRDALALAEEQARKIEQVVRRISGLRRATGIPYVGETSMLDLESTGEDPA